MVSLDNFSLLPLAYVYKSQKEMQLQLYELFYNGHGKIKYHNNEAQLNLKFIFTLHIY